jgi:hypothetical protein
MLVNARLRRPDGGVKFSFMARPVVFTCSRLLWEMAACALVLTGSAAGGADLTVKVTEAGSETPMPGAVVTVTTLGPEKAVSQEGKSDSGGGCRLSIEANGAILRIDVKKSGWCPLRLEIPAQSPALARPLSFPMKRAGTFGGSIRDETGKPVAGAHVSVNFPQRLAGAHIPLDDLYATSDAQGKWESDFVPAQTELLRITVTHPDYAWDGSQPSREELAAGNAMSRVQSVLALSGRVVGPDGKPVAGATVVRGEQYMIMGLESGNEATTGSDGGFRFPPQKAGIVQVSAFAPGFGPAIKEAKVGGGTAPVELRLTEAHPLRLRVTDLEGQEISGATVRVDEWGALRYPPWEFHDDGPGRYSLSNAPADDVKVDITAPGRMSLIMYSVSPGQMENVVKLSPALRLHGKVGDAATKRPVEKFTVTAGWPRQVFQNGVMTNEGAEFGMSQRGREFTEGTYDWTFTEPMVVGTQEPYDFILKVEADGYTTALSRTFKATEKDAAFDFELKRASFLDAVVSLPDGSPVSGALVQAIASADNLNPSRRAQMSEAPNILTDAKGHFQLPEPPQAEVVLITNKVGFAAVMFEQLRLSPEMKLKRWGRIEGNFKLGTDIGADQKLALGFPESAGMSFRDAAPETRLLGTVLQRTLFRSRDAHTDAKGHFMFDCVPAGQVTLMRVESIPTPQGGFVVSSGGVWGGCRMAWLDLKEGDHLNVELGGKGRWVVGKVVSTNRIEDGQARLNPVLPAIPYPNGLSQEQRTKRARDWLASEAGSKVRFWLGNNPRPGWERMRMPMMDGWPVKLAADGTFRIPDVAPGDYEFSAAFPDPQAPGRRGARFFIQSPADGPRTKFTVPEGENLPSLPPLDLGEIGEARPQEKLFAPEPTRAEPVRSAMQASADSVPPGGQFEVLVQARILSDFHIYGMDRKVSPFIPTSIKMTLPDGLETAGDWAGPSPARDKAGVEIYTGAAVFRRALRARAGAAPKKCSFGVELEYQVCNDDMCYPPRKVELEATVEIAAARQP